MALPKLKDIKWVTDGLLRHPDRLGEGHHRRLQEGGRPGRPHDRRQGPARALLRGAGADHGRLLRALRRGPAPRRRHRRRGDRLDDRALTRPVPARQRRRAGSPFARRTPRWTGSRSATTSASSPTSTTSCSGISRRHLRTELDLVVTAQQVRSYKPDETHFRECARRIGGKQGWVHIAAGLRHRHRALHQAQGAGDLGQPPRREARRPQGPRRHRQEPARSGGEARSEVASGGA